MKFPDVDALAGSITVDLGRSTAVRPLYEEFLRFASTSEDRDDIHTFNSCVRAGGDQLTEAEFVRAFMDDVLTSPKAGGWPETALGLTTLRCAEQLQYQHLPPSAQFLPPSPASQYDVPEAKARASRLNRALPSLEAAVTDVLLSSAKVSAQVVRQLVGPTSRCYRGFKPTKEGLRLGATVFPQRALSAWTDDEDSARDWATPVGRVMTVDAPAELVWILPGHGEGELVLGLAPPTTSQTFKPPQYKWL